jgi:cardiolipin synthase
MDPLTAVLAFFVPLVHISGLYCAYQAITHTRTAQGAVAWAVSLVTLPYFALPLYLVFGRRKFVGYIESRRAGDLALHHIGSNLKLALEEHRSELSETWPPHAAIEELARLRFSRGNRVKLLKDGQATFESIFAGFDQAQEYILAQFFIIEEDGLGLEFQRRLIERAEAGVRVYLLFDEVGCIGLSRGYIAKLRAAGVLVRPFHTRRGLRNRFQINFRNHRKVVVIDGRVAFVGGLNVGDEYLGLDPDLGPWRDTHARYEGPVATCVQLSFVEDWYWASRAIPELNWDPEPCSGVGTDILALPSGPADALDTAGLFYVHAINSAQQRVWISSPYFVPDDRVLGALQLAALRGVDVRILLPQKADHYPIYLSSFAYIRPLVDVGVKIYRYQPGFLHQKVLLVDDQVGVVGTANLDNRSFRLNFEITMAAVDRGFAGEVEAMLREDLAHSKEVPATDLESRGVLFRFLVNLSRLAAPVQ